MNYKDKLQGPIFSVLQKTADSEGVECYVIGGYVRDVLLSRPSKDIDVVVVGSGISFAEAFTKNLGMKAHLSVFKNFGTAQVKIYSKNEEPVEVEFVGARKESYRADSRKPIEKMGP